MGDADTSTVCFWSKGSDAGLPKADIKYWPSAMSDIIQPEFVLCCTNQDLQRVTGSDSSIPGLLALTIIQDARTSRQGAQVVHLSRFRPWNECDCCVVGKIHQAHSIGLGSLC